MEVKCKVPNNNVQVSVKDEGPGIEVDNLEKIFDRYYRGEKNSKVPGFGIGL